MNHGQQTRYLRLAQAALALATISCNGASGSLQTDVPPEEPAGRVSDADLPDSLRALGLGARHALQAHGVQTDARGGVHTRYQQYYRGLRVVGATAVTHTEAGHRERAPTVNLVKELDVDVAPAISASAAERIADEALSARAGRAPEETSELVLVPRYASVQRADRRSRARAKPNATDFERVLTGVDLAYLVHVDQGANLGDRATDCLVEARTGVVLSRWSGAQHVLQPKKGQGKTQYSGKVELDVTYEEGGAGPWNLIDLTRSTTGNRTYNANYMGDDVETPPRAGGWQGTFPNKTSTWGDGSNLDVITGSGLTISPEFLPPPPPSPTPGGAYRHSNPFSVITHGGAETPDGEVEPAVPMDPPGWHPISTTTDTGYTAGADVHYGVMKTWDFYGKVFRRTGFDGVGTPVTSEVHYGLARWNAYWVTGKAIMRFGDAYPPFLNQTSLPTVAHEFTHGVWGSVVGDVPPVVVNGDVVGEHGGIYEANSDFFGLMTRFWVHGLQDEHIPETAIENGASVRWVAGDLEAPNLPPDRIFYKPSLVAGTADEWSPALAKTEIHSAAGPFERCLYFLSRGADPVGSGTDTTSSYLPQGMTGLGNDKTAGIWYHALNFLSSTGGYADARAAAIVSAIALYGESSPEERAVWDAFGAINVGDTWSAGHDLVEDCQYTPDNDSQATADVVVNNHSTVQGWIAASQGVDQDWYRFLVYGPATLTVGLTSPLGHDYDFRVFDLNGVQVGSSLTTTQHESIPLAASGVAQTFFVKIFAKHAADFGAGASEFYTLSLDY
jgi:Zn-dependent metalloprotease